MCYVTDVCLGSRAWYLPDHDPPIVLLVILFYFIKKSHVRLYLFDFCMILFPGNLPSLVFMIVFCPACMSIPSSQSVGLVTQNEWHIQHCLLGVDMLTYYCFRFVTYLSVKNMVLITGTPLLVLCPVSENINIEKTPSLCVDLSVTSLVIIILPCCLLRVQLLPPLLQMCSILIWWK